MIEKVQYGDWSNLTQLICTREIEQPELDSNATGIGSLIITTVAEMERELLEAIKVDSNLSLVHSDALETGIILMVTAVAVNQNGNGQYHSPKETTH